MNRSLGLVGFGDFGKLIVRELAEYFEIFVYIKSPKQYSGVNFSDLETVLSKKIIILAIPAQYLEDFLEKNRTKINPNALVIDVCSVKVRPEMLMKKFLPSSCDIIASHPMFGPASAKDSIEDLKLMIYPSRISSERFKRVKDFVRHELKLQIIETTPEEHDRAMAYVQGLSHYIGRAMQMMDIPNTPMATKAYEDLYDMKLIQGHDSWELFRSIMQVNPYAMQVNEDFKKIMKQLDKKLNE